MRILGLGYALVALAAAGLAILSLTYGDFAPMWHAIPAGIPGRELWVRVSALLVLAASAGLCFSRTALRSALVIGAYEGVWLVTGVPPILKTPLSVGAWYGLVEAMTSLVGVWIAYSILQSPSQGSQVPMTHARTWRVASALLGFACVFYGYSHFAYADYTAGMVPDWLAFHIGFAYFTGGGYVAAGIGMVLGILARLAATLVAVMMSLFGILVWVPTLIAQQPPSWARPPQNQWSELEVSLLLAASAWIVADSLKGRPWGFSARSRN